mgnify:CR=1 FL=1
MQPKYKRVLLKLSGEALAGAYHPALGEMAQSARYLALAEREIEKKKLKKEEINKKTEDALKKVGLFEKSSYNCRFLSGGEKRRLEIACMLAFDVPILVLDEPYANLDYLSIKSLNKLIEQLKNEGKTIIILSHELEKCLALADKMIVLHKGKIVFDGTTKDGLLQDLEQWNLKNPLAYPHRNICIITDGRMTYRIC